MGVTTDLRSRLGMPAVRAPLPVACALSSLFADGGLPRGRTVACTGDAALSAALALSAAATRAGSWLAVVGVPQLGVGAALEAGVAIERLVLAQPPTTSRAWVTTVAALVEGFEVLVVAPPASLTEHDARRLQSRIVARQSVLVVVHVPVPPSVVVGSGVGHRTGSGASRVFSADLDVHANTESWSGIERGGSHITQRMVHLRVGGRRAPLSREATLDWSCLNDQPVS